MPQDIPLEASETLAFTPASLRDIEGAPAFVLRTFTPRDKRHHQRLLWEEGLQTHGPDDIRAEILVGLRAGWTEEQVAEHEPTIRAYWDARDDYELQKRDEPDLEFEYDPEIQRAVDELVRSVTQEWHPVRRMIADNRHFGEMLPLITAATTIKSWTGLEVPRRLDRGYLTVDCADALAGALERFEKRHAKRYDLKAGTAWLETVAACFGRLAIDEDEEKNSESPSPSRTLPPSSEPTEPDLGKSPAPARSKKTRETA